MPDHYCPHAQDFGAMKKTLKKVDDCVNGNGKDGLVIEVDRLKRDKETMIEELSTIARAMSDFADSEKERVVITAERERNKEVRTSAIEKVGKYAAIVFGFVATLYLVLDYIG